MLPRGLRAGELWRPLVALDNDLLGFPPLIIFALPKGFLPPNQARKLESHSAILFEPKESRCTEQRAPPPLAPPPLLFLLVYPRRWRGITVCSPGTVSSPRGCSAFSPTQRLQFSLGGLREGKSSALCEELNAWWLNCRLCCFAVN